MFSRPAQAQHIPQILASANKGCAHTGKRVVVVRGVSNPGPAEKGVGVEEDERGQCADHRGRGQQWWLERGEGQRWWPKLIKERVSDHTSNVCQSGPAEAVHWDIWRTTLRQGMTVCHLCVSFANGAG